MGLDFPECPVCIQPILPMETLVYPICISRHPIYHRSCLAESAARNPLCPDCRQRLVWKPISETFDLKKIASLSEMDFALLKLGEHDFKTLRDIFDREGFQNPNLFDRLNTLFSTLEFSTSSDEEIEEVADFFKKNLTPSVVMNLKAKLDSVGKLHLFIEKRETIKDYGILGLLLSLLAHLYSEINKRTDIWSDILI